MWFSELQKLSNREFDLRSGQSQRYTYHVEVYPHTKLDQNRKNFLWTYGRMDTPKFSKSISSSRGNDLKTKNPVKLQSQKSVLWPIQRHMELITWQWPKNQKSSKTSVSEVCPVAYTASYGIQKVSNRRSDLQCNWNRCCSIGHICFPTSLPL